MVISMKRILDIFCKIFFQYDMFGFGYKYSLANKNYETLPNDNKIAKPSSYFDCSLAS